MKGLPSTYNKDLQDDKEVLFNSAETILMTLQVIAGTVQTLKVSLYNLKRFLKAKYYCFPNLCFYFMVGPTRCLFKSLD